MKTVILAGGRGTRIGEETFLRPKVLIEIGGKPILWHLLQIYSYQGFNDFIICLGYKSHMIKDYFVNFARNNSDLCVDLGKHVVHILNESKENWKITLIDTGEDANTGLRLARAESYIDQEDFFFTYGDGLSNVDLRNLKEQHVLSGKIATLTAVAPPGRFGLVQIDNGIVTKFDEKKNFSNERINGGFFVLNKRIFSYLTTKNPSFEFEILPKLAANRQLGGYLHNGFWQAMDTMRDKDYLEELLQKGKHPWMT